MDKNVDEDSEGLRAFGLMFEELEHTYAPFTYVQCIMNSTGAVMDMYGW